MNVLECVVGRGPATWYGECDEDGPLSVLARVTSLSGTGSELVQGQGPAIKVADVSTITCKVFEITDRDAITGTEIAPAPTLTADNVFDTLRTVGWNSDLVGYNFRHDVEAAFTEDGGQWRLLEYVITLTDDTTISLELRVKIRAKVSS